MTAFLLCSTWQTVPSRGGGTGEQTPSRHACSIEACLEGGGLRKDGHWLRWGTGHLRQRAVTNADMEAWQ